MRASLGFVGAGKVGCSLGRYLAAHPLLGLAGFLSRTPGHAAEAAEFAGGRAYDDLPGLVRDSEVVFLTTPDGEIAPCAGRIASECAEAGVELSGKLFAHCSGALSSEALAPLASLGARTCSMHPLYAVSSRFGCWEELGRAWFTLEGDEGACEELEAALDGLGNRHVRIPSEQKTRYHAAAVMASNLVVGLYELAAEQLGECGFAPADAEAALAPLFLGNAEHVAAAGPAASLTGPAARGDHATVEAHLSCLCGDEREVYRLLTEVLYRMASR